MLSVTNASCPLCGANATYREVAGGAREYACANCGRYRVTTQTLAHLPGLKNVERAAFSIRAVSSGGHTLVLMMDGDRVVGHVVKTSELPP